MQEPEIYMGVDCRKHRFDPTRNLRAYPHRASTGAGGSIRFKAHPVHPDCDDACYNWRLIGPGTLDTDIGPNVIYTAPEKGNPNCVLTRLQLRYADELLDTACISINVFPQTVLAYYWTPRDHQLKWQEPGGEWQIIPGPPPAPAEPGGIGMIHLPIHHCGCADNIIRTSYSANSYWLQDYYDRTKKTWRLHVYPISPWEGAYEDWIDTYANIDWNKIYGDRPFIQDARKRYMIEEGCCPHEIICFEQTWE